MVTAGSVGSHHGDRGAYWVLIDADVQFKCTLYDFEDAAIRVRATTYPKAEEFAEGSILRPQSEEETLKIFGPVSL